MAIFVTGTDTDVGKTYVAAWLAWHTKAGYWKPVQSGTEPETDSECIQRITGIKPLPERYRLKAPLAPALAAKAEGITIQLKDFVLPASRLIVEGAGGLLVPMAPGTMIIDLIQHLDLPVLLVARSARLGTLNHTLLSIEALKRRNIPLLGVILSGPPHHVHKQVIEEASSVPIVGELPFLEAPNQIKTTPLPPSLVSLLERAL